MKNSLVNLTYEIELEPGERLTLPESLIAHLGAGPLAHHNTSPPRTDPQPQRILEQLRAPRRRAVR